MTKFRALKYLFVFLIPIVGFYALHEKGLWSWFLPVFVYLMIPAIELLSKGSTKNLNEAEEEVEKNDRFYDYLVYAIVPAQWGLFIYFMYSVSKPGLALYEIAGLTFTMGIGCAAFGINVAHELGHRKKKYEQWMAKVFLLSAQYMHFFIEHNRGHHKNIATHLDPATSRRGENIYSFFIRSVSGGYISAWHLENARLRKKGVSVMSLQNEMVQFTIIQVLFTLGITLIFGWIGLVGFITAAIFGFLLLETVNYIEHYGLERKEIHEGVFEKTQPYHSWNSNHPLGRLLLYELTRHSDHHYHAGRKYQVLRHFDEAPQMPTGYPGMMLCALIPPLWFRIMHKQINQYEQRFAEWKMAA